MGFSTSTCRPVLQRLDADRGVAEVRRADQDGVNAAGVDHLAHVREGVLALQKLGQGADALAQGGDAQSGHLARADVVEMGSAHVAEADDAESYVLHRRAQASGRRWLVNRG